jgi:putative membrane protein
MEWPSLLLGTIVLRPYVFVFLAVYLTIAILNMGLVRSIVFTLLAYTIAFLSEYSSTRIGFPYGFYEYIETTKGQELWISNVPFMDSLSFSFLAYVAYTMALFLWCPLKINRWDIRLVESAGVKGSLRVVFSGAIFFMLMDVIIDPIAFQGDRWFLGKIYTYKEQGEYFNIPLTNFFGWLLVGICILYSFTRLDGYLDKICPYKEKKIPAQALLGPALYFGVLLFNLAVTFYIEEWALGACGSSLTLMLFWLLCQKIRRPKKFSL